LTLVRPRPVDEAISTAGGVPFDALDADGMLRALPGVFCAGEMLDWEAPTGGYLLTACFASGRRAGLGAVERLCSHPVAGPAAGTLPAQNGDGSPSNGEANR
jgi:predicted flavoprotein YhiN